MDKRVRWIYDPETKTAEYKEVSWVEAKLLDIMNGIRHDILAIAINFVDAMNDFISGMGKIIYWIEDKSDG